MNKYTKAIVTFLLLLSPTLVYANAGSPMMWFGMLHALILNGVIGLVESSILKKNRIPNRIWLIIAGNYISMFIGLFVIAPHFSKIAGNSDFWGGQTSYGEYGLQGFVAGMAISFFATLIIELPFFYLSVKNRLQRRQVFVPFLVANLVTNIAMGLAYYLIAKDGGYW